MLKIYDMATKIHSETEEHLEKYDEMLNQYGIDHAFTYPTDVELDEDENLVCKVLYMEEDEITFDLVTLLFCKTVLNKADDKIKESMKKVAA